MRPSSWSSRAVLAAAALAACAAGSAAQGRLPYPPYDPHLRANDHAGLLTDAQKTRINARLETVHRRTGVQIVVMTIRSIREYGAGADSSIEDFARATFNHYGIGDRRGNRGVLLLVAVDDRRARIELGAGYGRRRDADARRIMDKWIVPRFKKGDYAGGVVDGVDAIMREFAGVRAGWNWTILLTFAAVVVAVPIGWSLLRHGKTGWGWVFAGLVIILVLVVLKVVSFVLKVLFDRWGGGRYGRWHSAGSWGGGSSFGGGFSSGGGATGSW